MFWVSYADLMTSMFFLMLTLFITTSIVLNKEREKWKEKYTTSEQEKRQLSEINDAIQDLDSNYFEYVKDYKKHKLKVEVNFPTNEYNISLLSQSTQDSLSKAGEILEKFIENRVADTARFKNVQYLLIIEGQASRIGPESINYPLSYNRAYSLKAFWENRGIQFNARNCEVIICGSGDGRQSGTGLMREEYEPKNQRFLIHIIPKPGYNMKNSNETNPS